MLFDLDGTLVDSSADIAGALNLVLAEEEAPPLPEATVRALIGDGAAVLVRRAFAHVGLAEPPDALARFRARYDAHCLDRTAVFPGMADLVARLASARRLLGVITNKPGDFTSKVLDGLGLARFFGAIVGPEAAAAPKPSPEHVRAALALLGAQASECVVVGDGTTDVEAARAAGASCVGVLWGYRTRAELEAAGAAVFAETPARLQALLLGAP